MRLRVCLGSALLATGACSTLPGTIRVDVDGNSVEVRRKPEAPPPAPPAPAPETPAPDERQG